MSLTLPSSFGGLMALVEYIFLCCILHKKKHAMRGAKPEFKLLVSDLHLKVLTKL